MPGCCLNQEYVKADRETYEKMQPVIEMGIQALDNGDEQRAYRLLNQSWEARIKAGEDYGN